MLEHVGGLNRIIRIIRIIRTKGDRCSEKQGRRGGCERDRDNTDR